MIVEQHCQCNEEHIAALREGMAANDKEHESFRRRLHEHDERLSQLSELTIAVRRQGDVMERVVESQKETQESVNRIENRVVQLEREPAEKWKKITYEVMRYVVLAAIGVAVGYFIQG